MAFEAVRDVLDQARAFHHDLSVYYRQLEGAAQQERVRILLGYLSRHEERLEEAMAEYEAGAGPQVLNSRYKYTPLLDLAERTKDYVVDPEMSVEEVVRVALGFDDCLLAAFRRMAENAPSEEVRELFARLLALEESEEHHLARSALELNQI